MAGDSLRGFICLMSSLNGSADDGCATFVSGSFLTTGDFLKLGKGRFGFGAEKNDESDLAAVRPSLTAAGFTSFFAVVVNFVGADAVFAFFAELALDVEGMSSAFRFFGLESVRSIQPINPSCNEPA